MVPLVAANGCVGERNKDENFEVLSVSFQLDVDVFVTTATF